MTNGNICDNVIVPRRDGVPQLTDEKGCAAGLPTPAEAGREHGIREEKEQ